MLLLLSVVYVINGGSVVSIQTYQSIRSGIHNEFTNFTRVHSLLDHFSISHGVLIR